MLSSFFVPFTCQFSRLFSLSFALFLIIFIYPFRSSSLSLFMFGSLKGDFSCVRNQSEASFTCHGMLRFSYSCWFIDGSGFEERFPYSTRQNWFVFSLVLAMAFYLEFKAGTRLPSFRLDLIFKAPGVQAAWCLLHYLSSSFFFSRGVSHYYEFHWES